MKQTNNAIKFLMAQYRAIFKNAYFKGMASAVLLTAGLAAGAAQATTTDGVLEESDFNKDSGSVATVTITTNSNIDMGKLGDVFTGTNTFIGVNSSINGAAVTIKGEANRAIVAQGGGTFTVKNGGSLTITNGNNTNTQFFGGVNGNTGTFEVTGKNSQVNLTSASINFNQIKITDGATVTLGGLASHNQKADLNKSPTATYNGNWRYFTNLSANFNSPTSGDVIIEDSTVNLNDQSLITADHELNISGASVINFNGKEHTLGKDQDKKPINGSSYATALLRAGTSASDTGTINIAQTVTGSAPNEQFFKPVINVADSAWGALYAKNINISDTTVNIGTNGTFILDGNFKSNDLVDEGTHNATTLSLDNVTFDNKGTAIIGNKDTSGSKATVKGTVDLQGKVNNYTSLSITAEKNKVAKLIISQDQILSKDASGNSLKTGMFAGSDAAITLSTQATQADSTDKFGDAILELVADADDGALDLNSDVSFVTNDNYNANELAGKIFIYNYGTLKGDHFIASKAINIHTDSHLAVDANTLELGANNYTAGTLTGLNIEKATVHDHLDVHAAKPANGEAIFKIDGSLVLSRDYYTKDASGDYTTTLNDPGRITGTQLGLENGGSIEIKGGAFENEGQALTLHSGSLIVGADFNYDANGDKKVDGSDTSDGKDGVGPDWKYYKNANPASLTWTGKFNIAGANASNVPTISVNGASGANATLDLTRANVTWGNGDITLSGAGVDDSGDPSHSSATDYFARGGEGVLTITGNQFLDYLDLEEDNPEHTTDTSITLQNGGVLLVQGGVTSPINFNKFEGNQAVTAATNGHVNFSGGGRLVSTGELGLVTGGRDGANDYDITALNLAEGAIIAQGISINNIAPNLEADEDFVEVSGSTGALAVASRLSTSNKEIRFTGASLVLGTNDFTRYGLSASDSGLVDAAKLTFNGSTSDFEVNTGKWTIGVNGTLGDVDLTEGAILSVGADREEYVRNGIAASLTLDNLSLAGTADENDPNLAIQNGSELNVNTMQAAGTEIDINNGTLVINGRSADVTNFDEASEPETLVDLVDSTDGLTQAGISLDEAFIDVSNQGHLVLGDTAAKALVQFSKTPATGTDIVEVNDTLASATINLSNGSEFKLDFVKGEDDASAPEVNGGQGLTAEQAAMLKTKLVDNLERGSFINVGGLALDMKYDKETMTAQWSDLKDFMQIESAVVNNDIKQVLVKGIGSTDYIAGQFGAVESNVVGDNFIHVDGDLGLHKAREGYFASVVGADGQRKAIGLDLTQYSYLQLAGEGTVGTLQSTGTNTDSEVVFAEGEFTPGAATVEGNIKNIGTLTVNNDVTVTGNVNVGSAVVNKALSAKNVTLDGETGSSLVTGTMNVTDTLQIGKTTHQSALTVANGAVTTPNLVLVNGSTLQVGFKATDNDPDTDFNEAANYTGSLAAQTVDLGNGGVMVDPVNELQTAFVSFNKFKDASKAQNSMDLGTINGSMYVGNNSVLGIGSPDEASLREYVAAHQNNGALVDYSAILAVNGQATLGAGHGIVMTAQMPDDFKAYMAENKWTLNGYNTVANSVYFGNGTAMKVTAEAINTIGAPNNKNALITISGNDGKLIADGGEILISGEVRANKPYVLFTDGDNKVEVVNVDQTTAEAGEGITVATENGFLLGEINSTTGGVLTLGVNKNSRAIMAGASDPVYDTLVAYTRGYNGPEPTEGESTIAPEADTNGNGVEDSRELYSHNDQGDKVYGQYSNYFLNESVATGNGAAAESVARLAVFGGAAQAAISAGASTYDAVSGRMGVGANGANITVADNTQGAALWLAPIYKSSDSDGFDAEGVDYGVDMDLYGVALGADYTLSNGIRFGAMFNVGSGDIDGQGAGSAVSNDFDYYGFAVYGGYSMGALSVVADVSYTVADNDLEGNTAIDKVGASLDSTNLSVGVTGQYQLNFNGTTVTPHAGLRFSRIDLDDYTVDGEDIIADYDADSMNLFSIPVGVTFAKEFTGDAWTVKPSLDLTLTGNFGDDETDGTVHWAGVENLSTNVSSEVIDNFTYGATLGVAAKTGNFSLGLGVNYTGSSNVDEFGVNANARFVF